MLNTHLLKKHTLVKERLRALFIKKVIIYMSYMNSNALLKKGASVLLVSSMLVHPINKTR